jgi:hypothetical protein
MSDDPPERATEGESPIPKAIDEAFRAHDAFVGDGDRYRTETTVCEATATAVPTDGDRAGAFSVIVTVPTIDVAAADEVGSAVTTGWCETFALRLGDAFDVATTSDHDEPTVERGGGVVTARFEYRAWRADRGVADAKALVDYVEGTYAQGVIPGYEYEGPVASLVEQAA